MTARKRSAIASRLMWRPSATTMRAYLERWKAETGVFFDGTGPDSSDEELRTIAPKHPVFRISSVPAV